MRSSTGQHFVGLDHIRAIAAFMVVTWHFSHGGNGDPVPFNQAPEIGLLDEGHVGVSLFMVLSGYLFAKLISNRSIHYRAFLWNRAIRLLPLLISVLIVVGIRDYRNDLIGYAKLVSSGLLLPTLPNGGWSITTELHFYLIMPFLLLAAKKSKWAPLALVFLAICIRFAIVASGNDIKYLAYGTLLGRFDQFAIGIFFSCIKISGRGAACALVALAAIYYVFDAAGGFFNGPDWPWLFLPTVEALAFGAMVSWYDVNPIKSSKMWLVQKAGEYSYSIYLLHFFLVFSAARFVDTQIMELTSVYVALPWALLFFVLMTGVGHFSYVLIERPALRFRKPYMTDKSPPVPIPVDRSLAPEKI